MSRARDARRGERGQVMPIVAVAAVILLGSAAVAVDLSINTHQRRGLQNLSDSSSLAAAQELSTPAVTQAQRIAAATAALRVIHTALPWPADGGRDPASLVAASTTCAAGRTACSVSVSGLPGAYSAYAITVSTPPASARNPAFDTDGYVEVDIRQSVRGELAAGIGFTAGEVGAHSVAYHLPPGVDFGFALYAGSYVTSGNDSEVIAGNIFAGVDLNPQSNGQAFICAAVQADGSGGSVVLGAPQYPEPPSAGTTQPQQYLVKPPAGSGSPDVVQLTTPPDCSAAAKGNVSQTSAAAAAHLCPGDVTGTNLSGAWDADTQACVVSGLQAPAIEEPTIPNPAGTDYSDAYCEQQGLVQDGTEYTPGRYLCGGGRPDLHVDHPLAPGVYEIADNPACTPPSCFDVLIDGAVGRAPGVADCSGGGSFANLLCGVTFVLDGGASIGVIGNGTTVYETPASPPSGSANSSDGRIPVWGAGPAELYVDRNGATYSATGTLYLPAGTVHVESNGYVQLAGQAIVGVWDVSSGNHAGPDVAYSSSQVAPEREELRLVE